MEIRVGCKYIVEEFYYNEHKGSYTFNLKRYEYFDKTNKGYIKWNYIGYGDENQASKTDGEKLEKLYQNNKRVKKLERILDDKNN